MAKVKAELVVPASLAEAWDLYFDCRRWPAWVDQFHAVESLEPPYPDVDGRLTWRSGSSGRGTVTETVLEHEPRRLHRIRFEDPQAEGELTTTFEMQGAGTKVRLDLVYGLKQPALFGPVTDRLFVRGPQRSSLQRSLQALRAEAGA